MAKTELEDLENIVNIYKKKVKDNLIKHLIEINKPYELTLNGTKIKVEFSAETNAPTIEEALVKIATKKIV